MSDRRAALRMRSGIEAPYPYEISLLDSDLRTRWRARHGVCFADRR
jgi:hypothetical protein